ncbi:hypothetical protein EVAR_31712_1 [Eumeta japonica]|uniref:Uncharacterized protein n=1 Tax=Eumeta variegata TaxID=151549 RepID=A0A4C1VUT3_EUMVA|nr:hypothetical protein EVAR_31712_1 [Eumeta japonica]
MTERQANKLSLLQNEDVLVRINASAPMTFCKVKGTPRAARPPLTCRPLRAAVALSLFLVRVAGALHNLPNRLLLVNVIFARRNVKSSNRLSKQNNNNLLFWNNNNIDRAEWCSSNAAADARTAALCLLIPGTATIRWEDARSTTVGGARAVLPLDARCTRFCVTALTVPYYNDGHPLSHASIWCWNALDSTYSVKEVSFGARKKYYDSYEILTRRVKKTIPYAHARRTATGLRGGETHARFGNTIVIYGRKPCPFPLRNRGGFVRIFRDIFSETFDRSPFAPSAVPTFRFRVIVAEFELRPRRQD